ncbi:glycoside hydrolase family protein [Sneathiella glossodoripedis]|uniref:glycoside hydrolase family protein n=1 Tax=Sneathiella glossodoripedis TaxID=418853 RepID=UPI00046ECF7A|nr:glycoside hydrolase family protein [Sneathiella glossodoripedis]
MTIKADLIDSLVRDEGLRLKPYRCTAGKLTIGVGRNIEDNGITKAEAIILLTNDVNTVFRELDKNIPWWADLPDGPRVALANMCFNLGWPRLSGFKKMLAALKDRNFKKAADEALDSKWAKDVGKRSQRISELIRNG